MSTVGTALRFLSVFAAGVVAGGQVRVLLVDAPAIRRFGPNMSLRAHQAMLDDHADPYMPVATMLSAVSAVLSLIPARGRTGRSVVFTLLGLGGTVGTAITSARFNAALNERLRGWSPDNVPGEYSQVRNRWERVHRLRTVSGLLALAGYLVAALSRRA